MTARSLLFVLFLLVTTVSGVVSGAVCRVTKTADTNDGACNTDCSLREAVAESSCDTVIFPGQQFRFATLTLTGGELLIDHPVSIIGLGANRLTVSGNNKSRIFYVGAPTSISGLTLTNGNGVGRVNGTGNAPGPGGAIFTTPLSSLTLDAVHITGNTSTGPGGDGGGVYLSTGTHAISNSTFSDNSTSGFGSALEARGGDLTIVNSTIANNPTRLGSGALGLSEVTVVLSSSTLADNSPGASILTEPLMSLNFGNSIIDGIAEDVGFSFSQSAGNNLIIGKSTAGHVMFDPSDIFDFAASLDPLQLGAGSTPTMDLPAGSPAINAGNNGLALGLPINLDQRGLRRFIDGNSDGNAKIDIGAVETGQFQPPSGAGVYGRIFGANGRPASGSLVSIATEEGDYVWTVITNHFGYYRVYPPGGRYCTITVSSKHGTFLPVTVMTYQTRENIIIFAR